MRAIPSIRIALFFRTKICKLLAPQIMRHSFKCGVLRVLFVKLLVYYDCFNRVNNIIGMVVPSKMMMNVKS